MRRMVVIVALLASLAVIRATTRPADAHVCAAPVQVDVDAPSTVSVGVTAESIEVTGVDVEVPDGFELAGADAEGSGPGEHAWTVQRRGAIVLFRGGSVPPFSCGYLSLTGTATERGVLIFPLVLHGADGSTRRLVEAHPNDPEGAQMVYAGVDVPTAGGGSGDDLDPLAVAGWTLIVVGACAGIVWYLWRCGVIGRSE